LIATLAIGVTLPSASMRTGTVFFVAVATSTGTARCAVGRGACASAPLSHEPAHFEPSHFAATTPPATSNTTIAPHTNVRFFIIYARSATRMGPLGLPLFLVPRS
jgi:hypothetical protein